MPKLSQSDDVRFEEKIPGMETPGLKVSDVITSPAGVKIRVIQLSQHSVAIVAATLPPGVDELQTVVTGPAGSDVTTIAMSWGEFWDGVGNAIKTGAQLITGGCKTVVHQDVTINDQGVMTGYHSSYSLDCSGA